MLVRHSSGVLALVRVVFAIQVGLLAWCQPLTPKALAYSQFGLSTMYCGWALLLLSLAARNCWLDCRLSPCAHVIDLTVFSMMLVASHVQGLDAPDQFTGFAVFLLIVGMVRWHRLGLGLTATVLVLTELAATLATLRDITLVHVLPKLGGPGEMAIISLLLCWLGIYQRRPPIVDLPEPLGQAGERRQATLAGALACTRAALGADGAAMAVTCGEEPWIDVLIDRAGVVTIERVGPNGLGEVLADGHAPCLFDRRRQRAITLAVSDRVAPVSACCPMPLADICNVDQGLLASFHSESSQGQVLVWGKRIRDADSLMGAKAITRAIGQALDREEIAALAKTSAVAEVRDALARDLHDSIVQFLAGTLFRLEALRRRLREGGDPEDEIAAMKDALRREQVQMRVMIDRLRRGEDGDRATDLADECRSLLDELAHHWHIGTTLEARSQPLPVPIHLAYELRQLVREAVANAVRHGAAHNVVLILAMDGNRLDIAISDDGIGLPANAPEMTDIYRPKSISERVAALGGRVHMTDLAQGAGGSGVRLDIDIPVRVQA